MFSIDRSACISCGRCARACPVGIFRVDETGAPQVGREKRCLRCMHCAAACPVRAVRAEGVGELYPAPASGGLAALIQARRAIRHVAPQPPDRALLERCIQAAAWAPSAKNARAHRFVVLYGREQADRAGALALEYARAHRLAPELILSARAGRNLVTCGAPCAVLCCAREDGDRGALDSAIALSTLELLLVEAGLGTCWGGYLARLASLAPALREWLGLEEGWQVYCTLMVGASEGEDYPNVPPREPVETRWIPENT